MPRVAISHGLATSTAEVTLRFDNHITISIETALPPLLEQLTWDEKPNTLNDYIALDDKKISHLSKRLKTLFDIETPVFIGANPLDSKRVTIPNASRLKTIIQSELSSSILNKQFGQAQNSDRSHYLRITIEGFIPKQSKTEELDIVFPKVLGPIIVSYVKPIQSTLSPSEDGTHYRVLMN